MATSRLSGGDFLLLKFRMLYKLGIKYIKTNQQTGHFSAKAFQISNQFQFILVDMKIQFILLILKVKEIDSMTFGIRHWLALNGRFVQIFKCVINHLFFKLHRELQ